MLNVQNKVGHVPGGFLEIGFGRYGFMPWVRMVNPDQLEVLIFDGFEGANRAARLCDVKTGRIAGNIDQWKHRTDLPARNTRQKTHAFVR